MADFNVSAVLRADASNFTAGTKAAAAANDQLSDSVGGAVSALRGHEDAVNRSSSAQIVLQSAIRKTTDQFAAGAPLSTIFAEHLETVVEAAELAGGSLGKVGAFLSGPWGIAITGAVSVLSIFIPKLFDASDATDDLKNTQATLASFLDKTTGKVKEQISYLALLGKSQDAAAKQQSAYQNYQTARGQLTAGIGKLTDTTGAPEAAGLVDAPGASFASTVNQAGVKTLNTLLVELNSNTINVTQATRLFQAAAANNKSLADVAPQFLKLAGAVGQASDASNAATVELARVAVAAGTASAAQKALVASSTEGVKADVAVADARAKLAAADGAVAKAEAALTLYQTENRKAAEAGGTAYADYSTHVTTLEKAVTSAKEAQKAATEAAHDHAAGLREADAAARQAAEAERQFDAALASIIGQLDPGAKAVADFATQIGIVSKAYAEGKIELGEYLQLTDELQDKLAKAQVVALKQTETSLGITPFDFTAFEKTIDEETKASVDIAHNLQDGAAKAAAQFRKDGLDAASAIGDLLGGKIGGLIGTLTQALGGTGPLGSIEKFLGDISGGSSTYSNGQTPEQVRESQYGSAGTYVGDSAAVALAPDSIHSINEGFSGSLKQWLDTDSPLGKTFKSTLGGLAEGLASSGLIGDSTGNKVGGALGGALGEAFGKKALTTGLNAISKNLGQFAGPLAGALGGLLGSLLGGLFTKVKEASATVTGFGSSDVSVTGNSKSYEQQAGTLGSTLQTSLQSIIDHLGGTAGDFSVSIGERKKKYVVDPSGGGATHGGDTQKYSDAQSAEAAALTNAIADGAVKGLSAAVEAALKSSSDVTTAVQTALDVQNLETAIGGLDGSMQATLKTAETTAQKNIALATKYGLDLTKVTALNEKNRAAAIQGVIDAQLGSLKDLQASLSTGDLFEGSAADKIKAVQADITSALADFANGVSGAGDRLATDYQSELSDARDAYGTAGPEYATIYDNVTKSVTDLIAQTTKQANDAEAAVQKQLDLSNENNDQNAQIISGLNGVQGAITTLGQAIASGGYGAVLSTARSANSR